MNTFPSRFIQTPFRVAGVTVVSTMSFKKTNGSSAE
jgi:hypothetical protein